MSNKFSPYEYKNSIKRGFIYLLIASPFMLAIATVLTIVKAPYWLTMLATIVVGGFIVLICAIVRAKMTEKKERNKKDKFDPFKD